MYLLLTLLQISHSQWMEELVTTFNFLVSMFTSLKTDTGPDLGDSELVKIKCYLWLKDTNLIFVHIFLNEIRIWSIVDEIWPARAKSVVFATTTMKLWPQAEICVHGEDEHVKPSENLFRCAHTKWNRRNSCSLRRDVLPAGWQVDIGHRTCTARDHKRSRSSLKRPTWIICPSSSLKHLDMSVWHMTSINDRRWSYKLMSQNWIKIYF